MSLKRGLFIVLVIVIGAVGMVISVADLTAANEIVEGPEYLSGETQTTITLNAVADATVREWEPDTNFGDEASLELSYGGAGEEAVTLVRFDLSSLPPDAVVDSASLRLYLEGASGADPVSIGAYAVTSAWDESGETGVTWNTFPTVAELGVSASIDGEAGSYKTWSATSFAQSWIDDPSSNYGVMLRGPTDGTNYERWFQSRESMDMVPQLEVTYHLTPYTFTGHVYEGEPEDTSTPLEGVTVELWGDEDEWPEGGAERVLLASDLPTGSDGAFLLEWDRAAAWPYLHVIETDPADAISTGAAVDAPGYVKNYNVVSYRYDDLLETGMHDFGGIAFWDRFPEELPDLIVTDVWPEGFHICSQVRNVGSAVAVSGHQAALSVDGVQQATLLVAIDLGPGERWGGCFDYTWGCSGDGDTMVVRADTMDVVTERDETNNAREEVWNCDRTAPEILSGPTVSGITENSAVISWETDEVADSMVRYDALARVYGFEETDPASTVNHQVTLEGLMPSTTYHYLAISTDPTGNAVESRDLIFETLAAPDTRDPTVNLVVPYVISDTVTLRADADDDTGVEKVEFYLDDDLVFTDYSSPYAMSLHSHAYADGSCTLRAQVYDYVGNQARHTIEGLISNGVDTSLPQVEIVTPTQWTTVSGVVRVKASMSDDEGLAYGYFWVGPQAKFHRASWYGMGSYPKQASVEIDWHTTSDPNGSLRIAWEVHDKHGNIGWGYQDVIVDNPQPPAPPRLEIIDREVVRTDNYFTVNLTVKNTGGQAATAITIWDYLQLFQPMNDDTSVATTQTEYSPQLTRWKVEITSKVDIPKDGERTYTYEVVPVMTPESAGPYAGCPHPMIGAYGLCGTGSWKWEGETHVQYQQPGRVGYFHEWAKLGRLIPDSTYFGATQQADYLIVTHPGELFARNPNSPGGVNALLSEMAKLAKLKRGALGYLSGSDPDAVRNLLRDLIQPGASWTKANWAYRLHPAFSTTSKGYLLIVGETEIVPAWEKGGFSTGWNPVKYSDQDYADTGGDQAPDLIVGRIVGDTAAKLRKPIQTSIGIHRGSPGYALHRDQATLISGAGYGPFPKVVDNLANILQPEFNVEKVHLKDHFNVSSPLSVHYQPGDKLAVGNVVGSSDADVVIADISGDRISVYGAQGNYVTGFDRSLEAQDAVAVADVGFGLDQIIHADESHDYVYVTEIRETSPGQFTAVVVASFPASFDPGDLLAVGDLTGDASEEVVVGDISLDHVFIRDVNGASWDYFACNLEDKDNLAVGDVLGDAKEDIIIADRLENKLLITDAGGGLQASKEFRKVTRDSETFNWLEWIDFDPTSWKDTGGSVVLTGDLYPWGKEEILIVAAQNYDHIHVYWWKSSDNKIRRTKPIPFNFDPSDDMRTGDIGTFYEKVQDECFIADADHGRIRVLDTQNWEDRFHAMLPDPVLNTDLIYLAGHGNTNGCCGLDSYRDDLSLLDFNGHNPIVFAASCLTGNYEDGKHETKNFAEWFLNTGASAFIGATQQSHGTEDNEASRQLFTDWQTSESIGEAFTRLEQEFWSDYAQADTDHWWFWAYEHNLYGDPKVTPLYFMQNPNDTVPDLALSVPPSSSLHIEIPDYTVATDYFAGGLDRVEIPDGRTWIKRGELQIPFYTVSVDYPKGYEVRDAVLTNRSEPVLDTGLSIPMTPVELTPGVAGHVPYTGTVEGWFPEVSYRWRTRENADGTGTLTVIIYPFRYNPLTTDVRFHNTYEFDIDYIVSPVAITEVRTDKDAYEQGERVQVDIGFESSGAPENVVVSALVKESSTQKTVDSLLLETLEDLSADASFSIPWESDGYSPGYYYVEVALPDSLGGTMDKETQPFRLGVSSGAITSFAAAPSFFQVGDTVNLSLAFSNTGTLDITGTATIDVRDTAGQSVWQSNYEIAALMPDSTFTVGDIWDSTGAERGTYTVLGYVRYDSKATAPARAVVSTQKHIYLPVVSRTADGR